RRFMATSPLDTYRHEIERAFERGDATEQTHRPALKTLIEALSHDVTATNEPKRVECGAPDFVISRRAKHGPVPARHARVAKGGKLTPVMGPETRASRLALRGVRHRAGAPQFVAGVRSRARSVRAYEVLRRIHDLPREAGRV